MTNRPTSRLIKGHFNALRASRSHSASETIDIASGNYGVGKTFEGIVGVSSPLWIGATDTFYVHLDKDDELVLDNISGFPSLSTKIARVEIVSGVITEITDERAVVNGLVDGYQVLFDDTNSNIAFGDTVQEALEDLDAYVSDIGQDILKFIDFDIEGGIKNGLVRFGHKADTPTLEFPNKLSGIGRVRFSVSIPNDYVPDTNIVIKLFWSPEDTSAGNVRWRIRHRFLQSGADLVDEALTTVTFDQASSGVANKLDDTGDSLVVVAANIGTNGILIVNIEREHSLSDTYNSSVRLHLARMEYTGRGIT